MNKWNQEAKQEANNITNKKKWTSETKKQNNKQIKVKWKTIIKQIKILKIKNWVLQTCGKGEHHVSTTQMAPQSLDSKKRN
jgi:hypothetical protein